MTTPLLPPPVDPDQVACVRADRPDPAVLRDATEIFRALGHPSRLALIHVLAHHEMSVGDLARALDLSLTVTSQHLAILRRLRLVAGRDEGRSTFYRVIDGHVARLVHDCLDHVAEILPALPQEP